MTNLTKWQLINRWVDKTPYLLLSMGVCIFGLTIISPIWLTKKLDKTITLSAEDTQVLGPVDIASQSFGTTRVEVEAQLGNQRWAIYEVQLLDRDDRLVLAGVKNAWRESGTWSEDGESGTWEEADKGSGFDLHLRQAEPVKIVVSLVEVSDTQGRVLQEPVKLRVTVYQGAIETLPLWLGASSLIIIGGLRLRK
jgi:hypothetical protein